MKPGDLVPHVLLRCENLSVRFSGKTLFSSVSRAVLAGRIIHLQGPNGTGKSTLLRVLEGTLAPSQGTVVRGVSKSDIFSLPQLQSPDVHMPFTLGEISCLDESRLRRARRTPLPWFPDSMRAQDWNSASGGERMRALLARALHSQRALLLLDEPFNHLDAVSLPLVMESLECYVGATRGRAIVVVSHDPLPPPSPQTCPREEWVLGCVRDGSQPWMG